MRKKVLGMSSFVASLLPATTAFADTDSVDVNPIQPGDDPIGSIVALIQKVGGWLLLIAGALVVVVLIFGGLRYLTSAGNSAQTEGAKKTIVYALIGLVIILLSYFLVTLVISLFS